MASGSSSRRQRSSAPASSSADFGWKMSANGSGIQPEMDVVNQRGGVVHLSKFQRELELFTDIECGSSPASFRAEAPAIRNPIAERNGGRFSLRMPHAKGSRRFASHARTDRLCRRKSTSAIRLGLQVGEEHLGTRRCSVCEQPVKAPRPAARRDTSADLSATQVVD